MRYLKYIILILYAVLLANNSSRAQNNSFGNLQDNQISISFLFEKIEAEAHSSIFNLVKFTNQSLVPYTGTVNISVPLGWNVIGESQVNVTIPASDSISLPVRVAISKDALGEIGYSVMATLSSANGSNKVYSSYFYVTIPRKTQLISNPAAFIYYIPEYQNKSVLDYKIQNKGNVQELVHLEIRTYDNLFINDSKKGVYTEEFGMKPNSDTTLKISVYNTFEKDAKLYNRLDIDSYNNDTLYRHTIWFKALKDEYTYTIPQNQKCAIIELNGYNLLSNDQPSFNLQVKGSILFRKDREIYYYSYTDFKNKAYSGLDIGYFNHTYLGFKNRFSDLRIGNVQGNYEQSINGIGANLRLKNKKSNLSLTYLEGTYSDYTAYGGSITLGSKIANIHAGAVLSENRSYALNTRLAYGGTSFPFFKYNVLSIVLAGSEITGISTKFQGVGANLTYDFRSKRLIMGARVRYGSPYYTGLSGGRLDIKSYIRYLISSKSYLAANYNKLDVNYFNYLQYSNPSNRKSTSDRLELAFGTRVNENLSYRTGIISSIEGINSIFITEPDRFFTVTALGLYLENNIKFNEITFLPRIEYFRAYQQPLGVESLQFDLGYNVINISANLATKNAGIYGLFKYGASSIFEHYLFYNNGEILKYFYLMPYYKNYFFNKKIMLDLRGNYIGNINNNEKTFNISTQVFWYLPKDFTIRFQNTIYNRSRIDLNTNIKYTYSNIYFEAGIVKEFNCNQPRFQYHNLKVVFFRDINGDRIKNQNEPGIINVLAEITRDFELNEEKYANFNDGQFLSNEKGEIEYFNIQNGHYILKYQLLNQIIGNFTLEQLTRNFEINKDEVIYIPFQETNKIIGKVILNRDPLTNLGPIDISNIRVVAEDTKGHEYTALTDKDGNFVLYTPLADHYIVKINNVFYESFDLQQSEYIVKFNGFKQFEVTFVFNEKKRRISFTNEVTEDKTLISDDLQVIRKTTLGGKIRDAISLEPVEAKIQIVDNKSNKVISSAISNRLNGNYSISYVAGENFRIEVKSEGYWDYVENLYIEQIISIQNIAKDIMINKLSDGQKNQTFIIYDQKEEDKFQENFKSGQKIPINNLTFEEKESRLNPNAYPELDRLIELLQKNKSIRIEVAGHADDSDKERINNMIAFRRASAVAKYLNSHGLAEDRIEVKSYSNQRPLVPGRTENVRQKNRRVEIIVK